MPKYTIAGIFVLITLLSFWLAAGRVFGYLAVTILIVAPCPTLIYLTVIRALMGRREVDYDSRQGLLELLLVLGLIPAFLTSFALAGLAVSVAIDSENWLEWLRAPPHGPFPGRSINP